MWTIIIVLLFVLAIFAAPFWPYNRGWKPWPPIALVLLGMALLVGLVTGLLPAL